MEPPQNTPGDCTTKRDRAFADPSQPWLNIADLARRFKTSARHIYRMADRGRMPWGVKLGALRRWSRREIEEWEAGGCKPVRPIPGGKR